jgi:hypothetical protein
LSARKFIEVGKKDKKSKWGARTKETETREMKETRETGDEGEGRQGTNRRICGIEKGERQAASANSLTVTASTIVAVNFMEDP